VEIKFGLSVTGVVDPKRVTPNSKAEPGDVLFLTKPLGTGFVTTAHKRERCPQETLDAACRSMIELNAGAAIAMRELGVKSATDVTGFGLAGHAYEMAAGSNVALEIDLSALPLLPGAEELVERGFFTRASKTNREYVQHALEFDGAPDRIRVEFFFDAQTSGGLLMAVPAAQANRAGEVLKRQGALAAACIGRVAGRHPGGKLLVRNRA
jgi:selenide,water dikinase